MLGIDTNVQSIRLCTFVHPWKRVIKMRSINELHRSLLHSVTVGHALRLAELPLLVCRRRPGWVTEFS